MKKFEFRKIMDAVGGFIVKFRIAILVVFALLLAFSVYGLTLTNINSDIMSYLPKGTDTYDGSEFFSNNFSLESNAVYAVKGDTVTYEQMRVAVEQAKKSEYISDILWLGSMGEIKFKGITIPDPISLMEGGEQAKEKLESLFYKDGNYLVIVSLNVGASTAEAAEGLKAVNDALAPYEFVSGGTAPMSRKVYDDAISELPIYLAAAIVLVLIILFVVSANWLEPLVFMLTMGVSILINMGTNFFFPEISIITFCAASILQLALAMDYSIFLTQIFSEEKKKGLPVQGAMISAIGTTFNTVLASALTTMGGFAAFFVMSFTLGADLGGVLIKGIFLAMLTVVVLQPCLLILLNKPMKKTEHKKLVDIRFKHVAKFSVRHRIPIVILFALVLLPAFIGQHYLPLSYLNFIPPIKGDPELVAYVSDTSNQIFLAVPVNEEDPLANVAFVEKLEATKGVSGVAGYYAFLPKDAFDEDTGKLKIHFMGLTADSVSIGKNAGYISESGYTMFMVSLSKEHGVEDQSATDILNEIKALAKETYAEKSYTTGVVQAVADFREITPRDFRWITILSVGVIFVVLIFSLKNLTYPFLLVLLIELGTWINFSISTIFGQSLNFLAYIVVGAIQLGATVDYAILVTNRYRALRKEGKDPMIAAYESGTQCTMSILTSASILVAACACVTVVSSNAVIKEITLMCMRGAAISTVLVLFVLPSLLSCTSSMRKRAAEVGGINNLTKEFLTNVNEQFLYSTRFKKAKLRLKKDRLLAADEAAEDLETRGLIVLQKKKGYRFNSDSVFLANLADFSEGDEVLDIGAGSGVMSFLVAAKKGARVTGLEVQPSLADMARRAAKANALENRVTIVEGDAREIETFVESASKDGVIANPPYFKAGSGEANQNEEAAVARHEIKGTLGDFVHAAAYALKDGGKGYFIQATAREKELLALLEKEGLFPYKKIYLTSSESKAPDSVIVGFIKGEKREPTERTLVTKDENGNMSKEAAELYRS